MHSFAHRHSRSGDALAAETHGHTLHLGWRYDLITWFCDAFLLRGAMRELRRRTIDLARIHPGDSVLDVGCGTGTLALAVQQHVEQDGGAMAYVHGIDPEAQQIARARAKAARRRLPVTFQVGGIEHLGFSDERFDVVLSTIMLHHLPGDLKRQGLAEIVRVLKPRGRLVIADFLRPHAPAQSAPGSDGAAGLRALVSAAGFSQVETDEMRLPDVPGLPSLFSQGAGFVRAQKRDDSRG